MIARERRGQVEVVRLAEPPLNLLGSPMVAALTRAFRELAATPPRVAARASIERFVETVKAGEFVVAMRAMLDKREPRFEE